MNTDTAGSEGSAGGLWDSEQAAEFLRMSAKWVKRQAQLGLLPAIRLGRALRFDPELIRAFVRGELAGASKVVRISGPHLGK
jgi:hypothetical protein